MELVIQGGDLVTPAGTFRADIGVQGGKIVALANPIQAGGAEVLDAQGRLIYPGGIDVHCHLPWPSKQVLSGDDLCSGTLSAACGGVTTVIDFVIPEPGEELAGAVDRKLAEVSMGLYADYCAHVCIREVNEVNLSQIPDLVQRGFISYKIFMAYEGFRLPDQDILRVMAAVRQAGGIVSVHAENGLLADQATAALVSRRQVSLDHYPESRPAYCEQEAINRILSYAEATGVPLHIHHVSTAQGAHLIGMARRRNLAVSGETCPQYLLFNDEIYRTPGPESTYLVIAPPLRKKEDQQALWQALACGDLSLVATDHCPYTLAQKLAGISDFTLVPGGSGGVETRWPLLFTEGVLAGRLSQERLAAIWATNPARVFGLYPRKGALSLGSDADLILVDPQSEKALSIKDLHMNSDYTAYEGWAVRGFPVTTLLRGKVIVRDGKPVQEPTGKLIQREASLLPAV